MWYSELCEAIDFVSNTYRDTLNITEVTDLTRQSAVNLINSDSETVNKIRKSYREVEAMKQSDDSTQNIRLHSSKMTSS